MGIRFHCPNGHKLNVKAFLAGKRGVCPHCGAKFEIPAESTIASSPPPLVAALATNAPAAATPGPTARPTSTPALQPAAAAVPGLSGPGPLPITSTAPVLPGANVPSIPIVTPIAPALSDPITEAPNSVWYVRPAAGGQYGPAGGEVMRQWITQRRVGADSLVWREGWPEWKRASTVFASLAVPMPPMPGHAAPAHAHAAAPIPRMDDDWMEAIVDTKPAHLPKAHPKSTQASNLILAISAVIVLIGAIVAISLIITAIKRANRENQPAPAPVGQTSQSGFGDRLLASRGAEA